MSLIKQKNVIPSIFFSTDGSSFSESIGKQSMENRYYIVMFLYT